MNKLIAQSEDLKKALERLQEAANLPANNIINQDATIQRFEFTFELSWKVMQTIVSENIPNVYGPKNVFREAAKLGIIDNPIPWFDFLKKRNLTVHTYNEEVAQEVYKAAKKFTPFVTRLLERVEKYIKQPVDK